MKLGKIRTQRQKTLLSVTLKEALLQKSLNLTSLRPRKSTFQNKQVSGFVISLHPVLQKAQKDKKDKDFGVKLIEPKGKTFGSHLAPKATLRAPQPIPPSQVPTQGSLG